MIESDMKTELKNSRKPVNQSVDLSKTVKVNVTSIPDPTNFLQHTSSQESLSHQNISPEAYIVAGLVSDEENNKTVLPKIKE